MGDIWGGRWSEPKPKFPATGTIVELGTFYLNGVKQLQPTRPWYATPTGAPGAGNIPAYSSGNIEIRETDGDMAYVMQWVAVDTGDKKLLIGDRNALVNVSWNTLNANDLIFGKEITLGGTRYLLRALTGGSSARSGGNYAGGTPTNNEWDMYICNEEGLPGLPVPTSSDLDSSLNATDFNGAESLAPHFN